MSTAAFILTAVGIILLLGWERPRFGVKARWRSFTATVGTTWERRDKSAKEYVARINGNARESFARKAYREARQTYQKTGQEGKYSRVLQIGVICGAAGALAGLLILHNWMLAIVLGVGLYFLPIWTSQFAQFHYDKFLAGELETALSLITASYQRSDDILSSVEENLPHMNNPVRETFSLFCNTIKYIDANTPAAIEKLKASLDNALFHQWCDALILCQENHLLQATLPGIVAKFSEVKAQQEANETRMTLPLRRALSMIALVAGIVPILFFANRDWYDYLIHTFFGQLSLTLTALSVFFTLHKGIRLSKPITYEV